MTDQLSTRLSRTDHAELVVERLLGLSLIREFVFRSPKISNGKQERELADFLVAHDGFGILFQQKCQQDPAARSEEKSAAWVKKQAIKAADQLTGAIRKGRQTAIWCDHSRRGRVNFPDGLPQLNHGIVLVESQDKVDLGPVASQLPLEHLGVPISYFTVSDFLNLTDELRTLPELVAFLDARRVLPPEDLLLVGDEVVLYARYLIGGASFGSTKSRIGARGVVQALPEKLQNLRFEKDAAEKYASLMEHVADQLATRDPELPKELEHHYEPITERIGYLKMQAVLANMRLADRIVLGRTFLDVIMQMKAHPKEDLCYQAAQHMDSIPDTVFVLASGRGFARKEYPERAQALSIAALSHYKKPIAITIIDRDGAGYDLSLVKHPGELPAEWVKLGEILFGSLKVTKQPYYPLLG